MVTSPRRTARKTPPALSKANPGRRDKHAILLTTAGLITAAVVAAIVLSRPATNSTATQHVTPISRARSYSQVSDCLLTDPAGIQGGIAAAAWAGMQAASATTHAQVSYLPIQGPDTVANAEVYINTLAMRGCTVILAAGPVPAQGAINRASAWPNQSMVTLTTAAIATATARAGKLTEISSSSTTSLTGQAKALLIKIGSAAGPTG